MSTRLWRELGMAGVLALVLGACAKPGEDRREVVAVWSTVPAPSLAPWVARFEEASPKLRVVVRTFAEEGFADSIASALAAGKAPDLATLPSEALPALMGQGVLSDWSAGVADLRGTLRGFELCMLGDAIYGLPWLLDSRVLYYNVDRWRAARGDDGGPRDAAALQKVATARGALGLPRVATFEALEPWAFASGVEVGTPSLDTARIVSDVAARTWSALSVLRRNARLASQDSLEDAFARGQLTLVVAGADLAARLAAHALPFTYDVVSVPSLAGAGDSRALVRGTVLASFTSSRRKEDALRFARYLVEGDALPILARSLNGLVPASAHADTTAWAAGSPARIALSRALDAARAEPVHPAWPQIKTGLDSLFTLAFTGGMPVAHALAAADTLIVSQARPR